MHKKVFVRDQLHVAEKTGAGRRENLRIQRQFKLPHQSKSLPDQGIHILFLYRFPSVRVK